MFKNFNAKHAALIAIAVISGGVAVYMAATNQPLPSGAAAVVTTLTSVLSVWTKSPAGQS